jgi:predicted dinucleotide-binding enzyme
MKIGFIDVGKIGGCLALKLKGAGHGALLANSRGPESLADLGAVESRWVEQRLGHPIVKAFNSISADSLAHGSRPKGSPERFALPVSGDDRRAKDVVSA